MKDRFSANANHYAQFRPGYPPELFDFIYHHMHRFDTAWDCGTGNGQAARELSLKFTKVFATDISAQQLEHAYQAENIFYSISSEPSLFDDHSVDLITIAQAAHWFDMKKFSREAKRVLKADGIIAVWGYGLLTMNVEIDRLIHHFYKMVIGAYWDEERKHIDEQYMNLQFPFEEIQTPSFTISVLWSLQELRGYLSTWSAVQKYISIKGQDPVKNLIAEVEIYWRNEKQLVNFPLFLKLGSSGAP